MKIIALFISFAMILASVTTVVSAATIGEGRTYISGFSVNDDESENLTIDYYFAMG